MQCVQVLYGLNHYFLVTMYTRKHTYAHTHMDTHTHTEIFQRVDGELLTFIIHNLDCL